MKKYIIVAETGSDIPQELADKYGIFLVPMHATFGDVTKDDMTFSPEDVCEYYDKTGKLPKTSGCNPADFIKVFDEIFSKYPHCHIIYMAYSAVTTCSFQSAKLAAEEYENISFIDTKQVTVGQCSAVIRLAQELEKHPEWTVKEVEEAAKDIVNSVKMCFVPSNMDYLRAGGRVSNATALCGNILGIHPRIELVDGYLKATKKYRGKMEKVVRNLIMDFCKENRFEQKEIWMGATTGFEEQLKKDTIELVKELGFDKVNWINIGGVITTHGGPNAFCITGFTKV